MVVTLSQFVVCGLMRLILVIFGLVPVGFGLVLVGFGLVAVPALADAGLSSDRLSERDVSLYWLDDPGEPLDLQQVINGYNEGQFTRLNNTLSRGYTLSSSWLRLSLTQEELNRFDYLWMEPSHVNEIEVFYQMDTNPSDAASFLKVSLGDHHPAQSQPLQHFRPIFPLKMVRENLAYAEFAALGEYQLYIRVRTTSAHAFKAKLLTDTALVRDTNQYLFFYAGFTTIAIILAAFSFFIAFRLRDKIYFWYAFYLLTIMAAYMPITGTFFLLFESAPGYVSDIFSGAGTGLGFFCFSTLCLSLLIQAGGVNLWVKRYLQLTALAGLLMALSSPFEFYVYLAGPVGTNAALFSLVLMICFAKRLKGSSTGDKFIFSALFLTAAGVLVNFGRIMGWFPENTFTVHFFQLTSLFHMLLLNQAFAERVMTAEKKALKAAQASEQRAKQLAEGMNRELINVLDQEKALRAEQDRFIDMVSHEYRTPLSILKTNLEILELKEKPDWTGRHNLQVMLQASERLQEVFDKSINGGQWKKALKGKSERRELVALLDNIVDEAHLMWDKVRFRYKVAVNCAWYKELDPALMKTVVFNLVDNARKYSSDPKAIVVSLREDKAVSALVLSVKNPVDALVKSKDINLQDKYVRGVNSVGTSGLGLGLNLVTQILDQQGDDFRIVTSEGEFEVQVYIYAEPMTDQDPYSEEDEHIIVQRGQE